MTGIAPSPTDMFIDWANNITNAGDEVLANQFWAQELVEPARPGTFYKPVRPQEAKS